MVGVCGSGGKEINAGFSKAVGRGVGPVAGALGAGLTVRQIFHREMLAKSEQVSRRE